MGVVNAAFACISAAAAAAVLLTLRAVYVEKGAFDRQTCGSYQKVAGTTYIFGANFRHTFQ